MTRLNWEKARRRDRQRTSKLRASSKKAKARQRQNDSLRQLAIQAFVDRHSIECFACGTVAARWATNGINKRGAWVICVPCVARNRAEKKEACRPDHDGDDKRELTSADREWVDEHKRISRDIDEGRVSREAR